MSLKEDKTVGKEPFTINIYTVPSVGWLQQYTKLLNKMYASSDEIRSEQEEFVSPIHRTSV